MTFFSGLSRYGSVFVFILASFTFQICETAFAESKIQVWTWTDYDPSYKAVIKVITGPENKFGAGTGTYIGKGLVLTAAHVVGESKNVTVEVPFSAKAHSKGTKYSYTVVSSDSRTDVAYLKGEELSGITPISFSEKSPKVGEYVVVCGYGSPMNGLRHFWTKMKNNGLEQFELESYVVSGDSGGPILYNGKIIGLVTGGRQTIPCQNGWFLAHPIIGPNLDSLNKVYTQCFDGSCQPSPYYVPGPEQRIIQRIPQPIQKEQTPSLVPIQKPDVVSNSCSCSADCDCRNHTHNYDELVKKVVDSLIVRIQEDKDLRDLLRGPTGIPGEPGTSPELDYDRITSLVSEKVVSNLPPVGLQVQDYEGNPLPVVDENGEIVGDISWKNLGDYFKLRLLERDLIRE